MLKFVDFNQELVKKVSELGIPAVAGDYFLEANKIERPVLMTASNPYWTFGGGIDVHFLENFPELCKYKRMKGGGNERIGNIVFAITVDENLKSTKEVIIEAIIFALSTLCEHETLVLCGVGTGIGGLGVDEFVSVLKAISNSSQYPTVGTQP